MFLLKVKIVAESVPMKHANENEFQKITRKKSKGVKVNKGEQLVTDEDGISAFLGDFSFHVLLTHHPPPFWVFRSDDVNCSADLLFRFFFLFQSF